MNIKYAIATRSAESVTRLVLSRDVTIARCRHAVHCPIGGLRPNFGNLPASSSSHCSSSFRDAHTCD